MLVVDNDHYKDGGNDDVDDGSGSSNDVTILIV